MTRTFSLDKKSFSIRIELLYFEGAAEAFV
jgi:hypothetical protein